MLLRLFAIGALSLLLGVGTSACTSRTNHSSGFVPRTTMDDPTPPPPDGSGGLPGSH